MRVVWKLLMPDDKMYTEDEYETAKATAYEEGESAGIKQGKKDGYDSGYDSGYESGYDSGYDPGYESACEDAYDPSKLNDLIEEYLNDTMPWHATMECPSCKLEGHHSRICLLKMIQEEVGKI